MAPSRYGAWSALGVLFLCATLAYIDRAIVSIVLEPMKAEFHVSDTQLGLLSGLPFAICFALMGIPVSRWADRGNRPVILALSILLYSASTALSACVSAFWQLMAARIGVGIGEAGVSPVTQSLIADYFPPQQRARANGVYLVSGVVGTVLVTTFGTDIVQYQGWRSLLLWAGAPGLLAALLAGWLLPEPRRQEEGRRAARSESFRSAITALVRKRSYLGVLASMVLYYGVAFGALSSFQVSFLVRVHRVTLAQAGVLVACVAATAALLGGLAGGALCDYLSHRDLKWLTRLPGLGFIGCGAMFFLAFATASLAGATALLGLGYLVMWAIYPSVLGAIHAVCGASRRATAFALAFFLANLVGFSTGPLLTGLLSDHFDRTLGAAVGLQRGMESMMVLFVPTGLILLAAGRWIGKEMEA